MKKVITALFILIYMLSNSNYNAQDWANLKKYQAENSNLKMMKKELSLLVIQLQNFGPHTPTFLK